MRRPALVLLQAATLAALVQAWAVLAAEAPPVDRPPTWASLSTQQRSVLAPLQQDWSAIDAERKQKWLEVARRFPSMPEAERERIQQRMADWTRKTPAERGRARLQYQQAREISPTDRQARWEEYKALPDEQREALVQRAKPAPSPAGRTADASAKRNIVPAGQQAQVKPIAPTVVQARPGATTSLMTQKDPPPSHQQPGMPKIAATQGFVDPQTLLPRRGPQAADVAVPPAGSRTTKQ